MASVTLVALVFSATVAAAAEDRALVDIRGALAELRAHRHQNEETRGATKRLTDAKHRLRGWIEARLSTLGQEGDPAALTAAINRELAGITCVTGDADPARRCDDDGLLFSHLGAVAVALERRGDFLLLKTTFGILCGEDDSAYLYAWRGERWRRIWESERDRAAAGGYHPQTIGSLLLAPTAPGGGFLVMTLGFEEWCSSYWHRIYYELWRVDPRHGRARRLLSSAEVAYLPAVSGPLEGTLGPRDAEVRFIAEDIDPGAFARPIVRHYRIEGAHARRSPPIALRPRDFVEEWLTHPWSESRRWSVAQLRGWHAALARPAARHEVEWQGPVLACAGRPDLVQIALDLDDAERAKSRYFFVRRTAPTNFALVDIRDRPDPDCSTPVADPDEKSLFPQDSGN